MEQNLKTYGINLLKNCISYYMNCLKFVLLNPKIFSFHKHISLPPFLSPKVALLQKFFLYLTGYPKGDGERKWGKL